MESAVVISQENQLTSTNKIFTDKTLKEFLYNLNNVEENAYQIVRYFTQGKLGAVAGFAMELKGSLENFGNFMETIAKNNSDYAAAIKVCSEDSSKNIECKQLVLNASKKFIQEIAPGLTNSKALPFLKLTCDLKDSAISTLVNNNIIQSFIKITASQIESYGLPKDSFNDKTVIAMQQYHAQALEFLNLPMVAAICEEITKIPNDYDSNFDNLHNNFMGVVNTLLDPVSLFGPSNGLVA